MVFRASAVNWGAAVAAAGNCGCSISRAAFSSFLTRHPARASITDAGLMELANLQKLTYLSLPTQITAKAAFELQKALPNCTIRGV